MALESSNISDLGKGMITYWIPEIAPKTFVLKTEIFIFSQRGRPRAPRHHGEDLVLMNVLPLTKWNTWKTLTHYSKHNGMPVEESVKDLFLEPGGWGRLRSYEVDWGHMRSWNSNSYHDEKCLEWQKIKQRLQTIKSPWVIVCDQ